MANEEVVGNVQVAVTPASLPTIETTGNVRVAASPESPATVESPSSIRVAVTPLSPEVQERTGSVAAALDFRSEQAIETAGSAKVAASPAGVPLSTVVVEGSVAVATRPLGSFLASDKFGLRIPMGTVSPIPSGPVFVPVRLTVTGLQVQTVRAFDPGGAPIPAIFRSFSGDDLRAYVFTEILSGANTDFDFEVEGVPE